MSRFRPSHTRTSVEEAAVAATPRLAAFGPTLNLHAYGTDERRFPTGYRLAQMVSATGVGLVVLTAPMATLAYATTALNTVASANRSHYPQMQVATVTRTVTPAAYRPADAPISVPVTTPASTATVTSRDASH